MLTGAVDSKPSSFELKIGKSPCQIFIICLPFTTGLFPHGYNLKNSVFEINKN